MSEESKYNFVWVDMSAHQTPVFEEVRGKDYILYGASKSKEWRNNYGGYLMNLYERSSKHRAIVNGKSKYIAGRGWDVSQVADFREEAELRAWLNVIDAGGELPKISKDKTIFGGFYLEIIFSKDGKKVVQANHVEYNDLRLHIDGKHYLFTSDWSARKPEQNDDFELIPVFDVDNKGGKSILAVNDYRPGIKSYAMPSYLASNPYIEADAEIANFTLNNIKNGFSAGYMIVMYNGKPSTEEQASVEEMIKGRFTGTDKAGNIVAVFSDGRDKGVDILPIPTNGQEDKFINLNEQVRIEIFTGHEIVNPSLFGIKENTGLGNNADELRVSNALFQSVYVNPEQASIEAIYNELAAMSGLKKALNITELEPIKPQISIEILKDVLTQDEIRGEFGYKPIADTQNEFKTAKFKADDDTYIEYFCSVGESQDDYDVIDSEDLYCADDEEFGEVHNKALQTFALARDLTDDELKVLGLLKENKNIDIPEVAEITKIDEGEVTSIIKRLTDTGAVKISVDGSEPSYDITTDGDKAIDSSGLPVIQVRYRYALRSDAPKLQGPRSRPFCRDLMRENRLYTREDIDGVRLELKQGMPLLSVWQSRGGWYNNPTTGRKTPFCRHIWQQVIVRKRDNG